MKRYIAALMSVCIMLGCTGCAQYKAFEDTMNQIGDDVLEGIGLKEDDGESIFDKIDIPVDDSGDAGDCSDKELAEAEEYMESRYWGDFTANWGFKYPHSDKMSIYLDWSESTEGVTLDIEGSGEYAVYSDNIAVLECKDDIEFIVKSTLEGYLYDSIIDVDFTGVTVESESVNMDAVSILQNLEYPISVYVYTDREELNIDEITYLAGEIVNNKLSLYIEITYIPNLKSMTDAEIDDLIFTEIDPAVSIVTYDGGIEISWGEELTEQW